MRTEPDAAGEAVRRRIGRQGVALVSDAVLIVDKPVGPTSFAVVRQVRHAAGVRRVGHGGTLDPLASGVLPVCLGEATKLAPFLLGADKEYDVTIRLGVETDTDDAEGAMTATCDAAALAAVTAAVVGDALAQFRGPINQTPPAYAAIKRDGRPLYSYARAGESIEVAARAVVIHALEMTHFGGPEDVRLHVHCSKGTYVRALARDLGRVLGVGGHVTALRRTRSGPFSLLQARPLAEILEALTRAREARTALPSCCSSPSRPRCAICPSTRSTRRRPGTCGPASGSRGRPPPAARPSLASASWIRPAT